MSRCRGRKNDYLKAITIGLVCGMILLITLGFFKREYKMMYMMAETRAESARLHYYMKYYEHMQEYIDSINANSEKVLEDIKEITGR